MPTPLEQSIDQLKAAAALIQKNTFVLIGDLRIWLNSSPKSWQEKRGHDFAEHATLGDRPKLQSTGNKLDELQIEFQLHAQQSNIGAIRNTLTGYKNAATVLPVTMGSGEYLGEFVLVDMTFQRTATFQNGTSLAANFSLVLRQYVKAAALEIFPRPKATRANPKTKTTPLGERKGVGGPIGAKP